MTIDDFVDGTGRVCVEIKDGDSRLVCYQSEFIVEVQKYMQKAMKKVGFI